MIRFSVFSLQFSINRINNKPPSFLGGHLLLIIPLLLPYLNVSNGCKRVLF